MGIKKIKPLIDLYVKELKKTINLNKVIVFGSYAKGCANKESDVDFLVVSDDFKKISSDKRWSLLMKARLNPQITQVAIDSFGITPEEYKNASTLTTLGEAKETGITVYPSFEI